MTVETESGPVEFYTIQEVARIFRVSEATVRREMKAGRMPFRKFRRRYLIPAAFVHHGVKPV